MNLATHAQLDRAIAEAPTALKRPETLARKVGHINLATHAELDRAIAEALTALKHPETLARARAEEARVSELLKTDASTAAQARATLHVIQHNNAHKLTSAWPAS